MGQQIPPEERLTNLVVALMATEIGLTKQQILETVSGYRQRSAAGGSDLVREYLDGDEVTVQTGNRSALLRESPG